MSPQELSLEYRPCAAISVINPEVTATLAIEPKLKTLNAPTLIAGAPTTSISSVKWSDWLADNIPGTRRRVEFKDTRVFFPEERWGGFDEELRAHWLLAEQEASGQHGSPTKPSGWEIYFATRDRVFLVAFGLSSRGKFPRRSWAAPQHFVSL